MPKCLHNSTISLYADDTEIYNYSSSDSGDLIVKTNEELKNVSQWMTDNNPTFIPLTLNTCLFDLHIQYL